MKTIIEHFREGTVGVLLLSALAGGLAFDLGSQGVERKQETRVGGARFEERAMFCPPPPARKAVTANLTMASESGEDLLVEVSPQQPEPSTLDGGHTRVVEVGDPADVIGRGGPVFAGATNVYSEPVAGAGAARCSRTASSRWYFGEGSSVLGFDESLLIYNPFPDEAVVRVVFFTNVGESAKANLADVGVPAGEWRAIRVNEFILRQRTLAASVEAVRGRVVSWRAATVKDGASGAQLSLGSPTAGDIWYLPAGAVGEGVSERIAVLNPSEEEAVVTVQLVTDDETVQPPKLVDLVIPARSSRSISLARSVTGRQAVEGGVGAIVRSTNGTDIVVEGTVSYDTRLLEGVASEMGVQEPEADWLLGPAAVPSETDGAVLLNPGGEPASVSIELWFRDGEPRRPAALQDLEVRAGTRTRVQLQKWTGGQPVVAVVASDVPIVAGRTASTSSDVATVMGLPAATRSER